MNNPTRHPERAKDLEMRRPHRRTLFLGRTTHDFRFSYFEILRKLRMTVGEACRVNHS
jgi:hypothetical protein